MNKEKSEIWKQIAFRAAQHIYHKKLVDIRGYLRKQCAKHDIAISETELVRAAIYIGQQVAELPPKKKETKL